MIPNAPKWSWKVDHKFNRMAFITRFSLVLVWSKIVQILTKSHPNGSGITRCSGLVVLVNIMKNKKFVQQPIFFYCWMHPNTTVSTHHNRAISNMLALENGGIFKFEVILESVSKIWSYWSNSMHGLAFKQRIMPKSRISWVDILIAK